MRLLSRLVVSLVVCLIAIALPSSPAQAQCGGPTIDLTPALGVPGTQLIIEGDSFVPGQFIDIYYDGDRISEGTTTSGSGSFSIAFTIPESCKGGHQILVQVGTGAGTTTKEATFYATAGLTVTPGKGPDGTTVTVKGHGFFKNEDGIELMYCTAEKTYQTVASNIEADANGYFATIFPVPASARGTHKIDAQGSLSQTYDVKDASFQVTAALSTDKTSGTANESVTMTGSRFYASEKGIWILFDGQPVVTGIKADSHGDWEATFGVPSMPAGNYTVTAAGEFTPEQEVAGLSFEIKPDMLLSPITGHVGTELTVTGHGFDAGRSVSIKYDGIEQAAAATDSQGNFQADFPVPPGQHGEHLITIGYSPGDVASATFTLESDPPDTPQLISPSDGGRVEPKTDVGPVFEWSAVSDESGVSYSLQIAVSPDITAAGEFVDSLIQATALNGTSYTVTQGLLPEGTYYWIVRAVDGAQNQGAWTAPYALQLGSSLPQVGSGLPLWALIAIIVGGVGILIVVIRAVLRRRRYYW